MRRRIWPLLPMVPLYGAVQALNDAAYERGLRRVEKLTWPVVSVGNLSVGGAGKTPFVIVLARLLAERGWSVDVLSRGYGRASDAVERVNTAVVEGPARQYGDEPWLIAQQTGVPVFVGRTRSAAGRLAESTLVGTGGVGHVHLLDDAMQHRGLARDAEIVLLHRSDFQATLLPAGRLREPMAALERADFVVLREEDATLAARARRWMHPDAQIWMIRRELKLPAVPGPAVIFCAIAHPEEFVEGVQAQGVRIAARHAWRDHHRYTDRDVAKLFAVAAKHRAACYLTTAKDAVRLTDAQRARLEGIGPLLVVELTARLLDQETALVALEQCLARRRVRESAVVTPK